MKSKPTTSQISKDNLNKRYYIISVHCIDKPGIVSALTSSLASFNVNIIDIEQSVMRGIFTMYMLADYSTSGEDDKTINSSLKELSKKKGMSINIEKYSDYIHGSAPECAKSSILVTVLGRDRPGIVHEFAEKFFKMGINIERIKMIARQEIIVVEFLVGAGIIDVGVLRCELQKSAGRVGMSVIFQNEDAFHRKKKLIVFDVDSTIISDEIIDEIAKAAGIENDVAKITQKAMLGEIDFKEALIERVRLLKGLPVSVLEDIADNMKFTEGTIELIEKLKEMRYKIAVISGGFTFFTDRLKDRLCIDYAFGNELVIKDGIITGDVKEPIVDARAKRDIMIEIAEREGISHQEVIAVGDGANDQYMISDAGLGIAFNPKAILKKYADGVITDKNIAEILYCLGDYRKNLQK